MNPEQQKLNPNLSLDIKFSGDVLAASGLRNLLAAVIEEGKALKLLATAARLDIEDFLQKKVFLEAETFILSSLTETLWNVSRNTPDIFIGLDTSISNPVLPFDDAEAYIFQDNLLACPPQESKSLDTISDINIVDEQELREVVSNIEPKHEKEIVSLIKSYKSLYSKWAFELRAGLGLLLYGFGSKKALIEDFASTTLTEYSVVVINGYLQSINLKQV
ncbi:hypothetical protein POM88_055014 [Heracleum sosnowskyi]|uniref:Origin recognition complex subunit 2 n=1 Tax=Heracleum sosnowskyi TaxID=360622 RepID=A0AAD8GM52_9APIA|nr:hypothetical protein POM88_055014 [Heracleum sosnowskyi]